MLTGLPAAIAANAAIDRTAPITSSAKVGIRGDPNIGVILGARYQYQPCIMVTCKRGQTSMLRPQEHAFRANTFPEDKNVFVLLLRGLG